MTDILTRLREALRLDPDPAHVATTALVDETCETVERVQREREALVTELRGKRLPPSWESLLAKEPE